MNSGLDMLAAFVNEQGYRKTIGSLNVGLVMTRRARDEGLPLDPDKQLAASGSQVRGLNGEAGARILREYGEDRSIGTEAGRTNRGSPDQMRRYVAFLNNLHANSLVDLAAFERFWVGLFIQRFATKPFKVRRDTGLTVQQIVRDLIAQAASRQAGLGGAMVTGTVIQHLVGAKLEVALAGRIQIHHHSANTSDVSRRGGDFDLGDAVIHVSTAPGDLLLGKCGENVASGQRPIIVTTEDEVNLAVKLSKRRGIDERVEIFALEQFMSVNANEIGAFSGGAVRSTLWEIIERYNAIIDEYESDPSLKIA